MQPIAVSAPFEKIGLDIPGSFPISDGGNRNVIVAIDHFTKLAETKVVAASVEVFANFIL